MIGLKIIVYLVLERGIKGLAQKNNFKTQTLLLRRLTTPLTWMLLLTLRTMQEVRNIDLILTRKEFVVVLTSRSDLDWEAVVLIGGCSR